MNTRSVTGRYASPRWERAIPFESTLERDFLMTTDFDLSVRKVIEQPCRISFADEDGRTRTYTPDFLAYWTGSDRPADLVEIKFAEELRTKASELAPKFEAAKTYAASRGWRFKVVTDLHLRGPRLENLKFLAPFRRKSIDPGLSARWLLTLRSIGRVTAADLEVLVRVVTASEAAPFTPLWHLVSLGGIKADLSEPLGPDTKVWIDE